MNGPTIQQIKDQPQIDFWHYLGALPSSMEAQILYALLLAGALGMLAHYLMRWIRGEITGSLFQYMFQDYPRRTALAYAGVISTALGAITANVFITDQGAFVGWLNVLWIGITNGYAADSVVNKGAPKKPDDPEATDVRTPGNGFALPELMITLAIVGTLVAGLWAAKAHLEATAVRAERAGYDRAIKEVEQRDNKDLLAAQAQVRHLQAEKDREQAEHQQAQAAAADQHAKEMRNAQARNTALQRDIDAGRLVYYDPGRTGTCPTPGANPGPGGGGSQASAPAAPAAGGEQAQRQGISAEATGFLRAEAALADEVATDLELCWSIARDDRRRAGL